jgi:hypothetical protein
VDRETRNRASGDALNHRSVTGQSLPLRLRRLLTRLGCGTHASVCCRWQVWIGTLVTLVTCLLTLVVAAGMRNDHADSYEYLRMSERLSLGAGSVARGRPPLLPLLQAPLWRLGARPAVWVGAHLLQVVFLGVVGVLAFALFRQWIGPAAGVGVSLLFLDRVFVHFAPSAMTDHLAAAALLAANLLWRLPARRRRTIGAASVGFATGILTQTKYILGLVPLCLVLAGRTSGGWRAKLGYAGGVALGLIAVRGTIEAMGGQPLTALPEALWDAYSHGASGAHVGQFSWSKVLLPMRFLAASVSPGLVVAGLVGVWLVGRREPALLVQLGMVLATLCFLLGEKEARYLLPVLPLVYAFAAVGIQNVWSLARRSGAPVFGVVVVAAFLVQPLAGAVREWSEHLRGELNRYPADALARRVAGELRPGGRVFWRGGAFALYRSGRVRMPGDEYYGVVRLGPAGMTFWLDRPCASERRAVPILEGPLEERRAREFVDSHCDGDAIVMAPLRGTNEGELDLVGLTIRELDQGAPTSMGELLADRRELPLRDSQDVSCGFVLAYCRGRPVALQLNQTDVRLCDDPDMLGPVSVTEMRITRLVP